MPSLNQPESTTSLRYIACISFPRSGHGVLVHLLNSYFGQAFGYCPGRVANPNCCRSLPCKQPTIVFNKNHDFELNTPKLPQYPYLIQIRNFLEAVVSDYHLHLRRCDNDDTLQRWQRFSRNKLNYYKKFVRKWLLDEDHLEKLVIRYEDFTSDPANVFKKICHFFAPNQTIDDNHVQASIAAAAFEAVGATQVSVLHNFGIRSQRNIQSFQHFDPTFFAELEASIANELRHLGYSLRFSNTLEVN